MPQYENESEDSLSYAARHQMMQDRRNGYLIVMVVMIFVFIVGMITGSGLHDLLFHALEN